MPVISATKLAINNIDDDFKEVRVTYIIQFSAYEIKAGSSFIEEVILFGRDSLGDDIPFTDPWFFDDMLTTINRKLINADDSFPGEILILGGGKVVNREVKKRVPRLSLNEDGDLTIYGPGPEDLVIRFKDEIYAKVVLTPFITNCWSQSNIVEGQFGS